MTHVNFFCFCFFCLFCLFFLFFFYQYRRLFLIKKFFFKRKLGGEEQKNKYVNMFQQQKIEWERKYGNIKDYRSHRRIILKRKRDEKEQRQRVKEGRESENAHGK